MACVGLKSTRQGVRSYKCECTCSQVPGKQQFKHQAACIVNDLRQSLLAGHIALLDDRQVRRVAAMAGRQVGHTPVSVASALQKGNDLVSQVATQK